jgi:antirestriction protein
MTARLYVGTYAKYNNGSIAGAWLDLENYSDAGEFYEACAQLHSDEEDPEFMFQDFEGFPDRFYSESGISDDLFEFLALDDDDRKMLAAYIDGSGDESATIEDAQEAFAGEFHNDEDFAYQLAEDVGDIPQDIPSYIVIDWEATARNIMFDYFESDGFYFRNL